LAWKKNAQRKNIPKHLCKKEEKDQNPHFLVCTMIIGDVLSKKKKTEVKWKKKIIIK